MSETAIKARAPAPGPLLGRHAVQPAGPGGDLAGVHANAALSMQRSAGNRAVAGLVRSSLATQALQRCSCSSGGGKCAKCRHDDEVMRRSAVPGAAAPAPTSAAMVQSVLGTPGHSLDSSVRQDMESHFGVALGGVRVHTDSAAAQSAEAVEAHAYTVGQHIVFGPSAWAPGTPAGRRLLAHELAHTIQQRGARKALQPMLQGSRAIESIAEREAEGAADAVMKSERPGIVHRSMPVLRRKKKKGSGVANAAKGKVINEAAGACGACYGPARLATVGQDVHTEVHAKVRELMPWIVDEERFKLGGKTDIPDLFDYVAEAPGARRKVVKVGELKPDSISGRAQGVTQMARYLRNIPKHPLFKDTTVLPLNEKLPQNFDFVDPTSPAGCPKQKITIRHWNKSGIYLYRCTPPWKELVRNKSCKCSGGKEDEDKKKKKDKKKDNKKSKNTKTKSKQQKKPTTKTKPKGKKPIVKKTPTLKKPGAKAFSLSIGIGINSSGAGAANIGVGISVNSTGTAVGTVGVSASYDSDGNAIGAVGAGAAKSSSSNIAGGAGATSAEDSSATGAGVASVGTAKKSDVMGAGVASKGSGENVTGTAVGKSGSGDIKDVDLDKAKSGSGDKAGKGGKPGGKPGEADAEQDEGSEAAEGDVRNTTEFKNAQAEAKRIEVMLAAASPAQKKLIAELVKRHPEHILPVPDEAFTKKWLNATSGIKDQHVEALANEGWQPGTSIDEAEFKRRVDLVISGKAPKGALWTSPEPPPSQEKADSKDPKAKVDQQVKAPPKTEAKKEKKPAKKDPDAEFRGVIANQLKQEGIEEELRDRLQQRARDHNFAAMDSNFEGARDPDAKGEQLTVLYIRDKGRDGAALVAVRVYKKGGRDYMKVLDSSDAVMANGKTFTPTFIGKEIPIRVF